MSQTQEPYSPRRPDDYDPQIEPDLEVDLAFAASVASSTTVPPASRAGNVLDEIDSDTEVFDEDDDAAPRYRGATNDPAFGFLIAIALSIGLAPLNGSGQAELRYTIAWSVLALFGVLAWWFGNTARVGQETPENIVWGVSFGLILGMPLLAFGGPTLSSAVRFLFGMMSTGSLLAYLVFVIPVAETLFFRGILQENRPFWMIGLMGSLWSVVLFFPLLDLQNYPFVAVVIGTVLVMMNLIYSYVRQRNGLAAAWVCQIVLNLALVFIPFLGSS